MIITTTYLKPRKWPLIILYLLVAFPFILAGFLSSPDDPKIAIYIGFILFTHALVFLFWLVLNKLEIRIYEQSIVHKTLFYTRELNWTGITNVDLHLGFAGQHPHVKWTFFDGKKSINIDPSYFSRADNRFLAEVVIAKCSHAAISASIIKIANGKFPWYLL